VPTTNSKAQILEECDHITHQSVHSLTTCNPTATRCPDQRGNPRDAQTGQGGVHVIAPSHSTRRPPVVPPLQKQGAGVPCGRVVFRRPSDSDSAVERRCADGDSAAAPLGRRQSPALFFTLHVSSRTILSCVPFRIWTATWVIKNG
jgi:hypothetical protein